MNDILQMADNILRASVVLINQKYVFLTFNLMWKPSITNVKPTTCININILNE